MTFWKPFDQLRTGDVLVTRGRTVTEADIVSFAAQTGDFHPQHVDADWAATSSFGERVAHGMLTLSYAIGLLSLDPRYAGAFRRMSDVVFTRPVRIGDTIRAKVRIAGLTVVDDDVGTVAVTLQVLNQDDRIACRARLEGRWARDPGGQASQVSSSTDEGAAFNA